MGDKPKRIKWTKELFIEKAKEKHGDKFDYLKVEFKGVNKDVVIHCNICGNEFKQTPFAHLQHKYACRKCAYKTISAERKTPFGEIIEKATKKHRGKYSYEGAEEYYETTESKIPIKCPVHGVFWQRVRDHIKGRGCERCGKRNMGDKLMLPFEEAVQKAQEVHGDFYNYEMAEKEYKGSKEKVPIICPIHGVFYQKMYSHFKGCGCPKCKANKQKERRRITFEEFVERGEQVHGKGKFEYYKDEYADACTHTIIRCLVCGEIFRQLPESHMRGIGCPNCFSLRRGATKRATWEYFEEKSAKNHPQGAYSFRKEDFISYKTPMPIICNTCGKTFMQQPILHANGHGCPYCAPKERALKQQITFEKFKERGIAIHGEGRYEYFESEYVDFKTKTLIKCSKCGYEFKQEPHSHVRGEGCPHCRRSLLEESMEKLLGELNIKYKREHTFPWLKHKRGLRLDFYLPEHNVAIECQGQQHFMPVDFSGRGKGNAQKEFERLVERDKKKKELCDKYGISLLYYNYNDDIIEFSMKIVNEIRKSGD